MDKLKRAFLPHHREPEGAPLTKSESPTSVYSNEARTSTGARTANEPHSSTAAPVTSSSDTTGPRATSGSDFAANDPVSASRTTGTVTNTTSALGAGAPTSGRSDFAANDPVSARGTTDTVGSTSSGFGAGTATSGDTAHYGTDGQIGTAIGDDVSSTKARIQAMTAGMVTDRDTGDRSATSGPSDFAANDPTSASGTTSTGGGASSAFGAGAAASGEPTHYGTDGQIGTASGGEVSSTKARMQAMVAGMVADTDTGDRAAPSSASGFADNDPTSARGTSGNEAGSSSALGAGSAARGEPGHYGTDGPIGTATGGEVSSTKARMQAMTAGMVADGDTSGRDGHYGTDGAIGQTSYKQPSGAESAAGTSALSSGRMGGATAGSGNASLDDAATTASIKSGVRGGSQQLTNLSDSLDTSEPSTASIGTGLTGSVLADRSLDRSDVEPTTITSSTRGATTGTTFDSTSGETLESVRPRSSDGVAHRGGPHPTFTGNRLDPSFNETIMSYHEENAHEPASQPSAATEVALDHPTGWDATYVVQGPGEIYTYGSGGNTYSSGENVIPTNTERNANDITEYGTTTDKSVAAYTGGSHGLATYDDQSYDQPTRGGLGSSTTDTTDTGPASKTIGPHESNILNVLDPRVQPEPEKMRQGENTSSDDGRNATIAGATGATGIGAHEYDKSRDQPSITEATETGRPAGYDDLSETEKPAAVRKYEAQQSSTTTQEPSKRQGFYGAPEETGAATEVSSHEQAQPSGNAAAAAADAAQTTSAEGNVGRSGWRHQREVEPYGTDGAAGVSAEQFDTREDLEHHAEREEADRNQTKGGLLGFLHKSQHGKYDDPTERDTVAKDKYFQRHASVDTGVPSADATTGADDIGTQGYEKHQQSTTTGIAGYSAEQFDTREDLEHHAEREEADRSQTKGGVLGFLHKSQQDRYNDPTERDTVAKDKYFQRHSSVDADAAGSYEYEKYQQPATSSAGGAGVYEHEKLDQAAVATGTSASATGVSGTAVSRTGVYDPYYDPYSAEKDTYGGSSTGADLDGAGTAAVLTADRHDYDNNAEQYAAGPSSAVGTSGSHSERKSEIPTASKTGTAKASQPIHETQRTSAPSNTTTTTSSPKKKSGFFHRSNPNKLHKEPPRGKYPTPSSSTDERR